MATLLRTCGMCGDAIPEDDTAYRCQVSRKAGRRYESSWTTVCASCVGRAREGTWQSGDGRCSLYGVPAGDDPTPCQSCGRPVVVDPDPRRQVTTCSDTCRARHYSEQRRSVAEVVTHPCQECGQSVAGRTDRRYCSPACRQRAYRQRVTA